MEIFRGLSLASNATGVSIAIEFTTPLMDKIKFFRMSLILSKII